MNSNKRTIIFRADGNAEIGMGHFMRSLSLAEMLKNDFIIQFAIRIPNGFQIQELEKVCDKWIGLSNDESHFDEFLKLLSGEEIVVLDNYYYCTDYQKAIKAKGCKLVCIDDLHDKHFVADAVINHAEFPNVQDYSIEAETQLYLGNRYALLRKDFLESFERDIDIEEEEKILICLGGIDKYGIGLKLVDWLVDCSSVRMIKEITLINGYSEITERRAEKVGVKVRFLENQTPTEMKKMFQEVSIGIFPASTVAIEACAMRLPFLTGFFVDNQKDILSGFIKNSIALSLGDFFDLNKDDFLNSINGILNNSSYKEESIKNMCRVLDKKSPERLKTLFSEL
jgi:UDP-2,4-diacetamido-2,4,6-trideoxy-beta-L-altropyranose hydrolase